MGWNWMKSYWGVYSSAGPNIHKVTAAYGWDSTAIPTNLLSVIAVNVFLLLQLTPLLV